MNNLFIPGTSTNIITNIPQFHLINVTPQLACWFLERSTGNRGRAEGKIRPAMLRFLEHIIERGEWQACHQGGAIDWHGRLFDGHHRLTAISRQDATLPMWFKIGCNPEEDKAIDQGAIRSLSDITGVNRKITETIALAARIYNGSGRVTPGDIQQLSKGTNLQKCIELVCCTTTSCTKYFSSAPMKLAAAIRLMQGDNPEYILQQYKAMVLFDFDQMSNCSKSLVRQVSSNGLKSSETYDTLSRGLIVFDPSKSNINRIQINDSVDAARFVRVSLHNSLKANDS